MGVKVQLEAVCNAVTCSLWVGGTFIHITAIVMVLSVLYRMYRNGRNTSRKTSHKFSYVTGRNRMFTVKPAVLVLFFGHASLHLLKVLCSTKKTKFGWAILVVFIYLLYRSHPGSLKNPLRATREASRAS